MMRRGCTTALLVCLLLLSSCASFSGRPKELGLPQDLPPLSSARSLGTGVSYLSYQGKKGFPPFHLLIIVPSQGAQVLPLAPFPHGTDVAKAFRSALSQHPEAVAAFTGAPFVSVGGAGSKRLEAIGSWLVDGREYGARQRQWGVLFRDETGYGIVSADGDVPDHPHWLVGTYLPILKSGDTIGIHGRRHARTAFGIGGSKASASLFVLVVEGDSLFQPGLTSRETAGILSHYGATEGINLDGGDAAAIAFIDDGGKKALHYYRGKRRRLPCYFIVLSGQG